MPFINVNNINKTFKVAKRSSVLKASLKSFFKRNYTFIEAVKDVLFKIEMLDIKDIIKIPVRKLSLEQRMRCGIAASLIHKPSILFLDEPTIGLDDVSKQVV